jgi:hypothetical protein
MGAGTSIPKLDQASNRVIARARAVLDRQGTARIQGGLKVGIFSSRATCAFSLCPIVEQWTGRVAIRRR